MKYFLDFEGTQFSHRIISIGAVCENGHSFYSLVKPESKYKIGKIITELTGITIEDIDNAKGSIEVFNEFYNWVLAQEEEAKENEVNWNPEWFCWGSEDIHFVKGTFKDCASDPCARLILGDIAGGLTDYGMRFCQRYNIKQRGLLRVAQAFDHTKEQDHNALNDAILLQFVHSCEEKYKKAEIKKIVARLTEAEEAKPKPKWTKSDLPKGTIVTISNNKKVTHSFETANEAAKWLIAEKKIKDKEENEVAEKILEAAKKRNSYYKSWRMIGE